MMAVSGGVPSIKRVVCPVYLPSISTPVNIFHAIIFHLAFCDTILTCSQQDCSISTIEPSGARGTPSCNPGLPLRIISAHFSALSCDSKNVCTRLGNCPIVTRVALNLIILQTPYSLPFFLPNLHTSYKPNYNLLPDHLIKNITFSWHLANPCSYKDA